MTEAFLSSELENFIRAEVGLPLSRQLSPSDDLEDDYGILGDDADPFMDAFFETFAVDRFDFDYHQQYFNSEGFDPVGLTKFLSLFFKHMRNLDKKVPITVEMLQRAVEIGRWDSKRLGEECQCLTDKARKRYQLRFIPVATDRVRRFENRT